MSHYAHDPIVPFKQSRQSKKQQVVDMFDRIAFRYDFLNHFLSAGIDLWWRKKAVNHLRSLQPKNILDVATGTADVAILAHKILHPTKITGIDISEGMLAIGRKKIERLKLQNSVELIAGDCEKLPFGNNAFDAVTVAFGVRNFQHLELGLTEILRVLRPGGKLVVLEFSRPKNAVVKALYINYMKYVAPAFSRLFGSTSEAYQYLNESAQAFPENEAFISILKSVGYLSTCNKQLLPGICSIYTGNK